MIRAPNPAPAAQADLEAKYTGGLSRYLQRGGEKGLGSAYQLGRNTMARKIGALEIETLHHRTLARMSSRVRSLARRQRALKMSGQFFLDALSPYEMCQRAYQDAVAALDAMRQVNESLEQEIKRIAHAVHDEAAQSAWPGPAVRGARRHLA